jgi:enamine deaminase RidA (YjgF/YER057c/UK114 family)
MVETEMNNDPPRAPLELVNPPDLGKPRGFAHGLLAPAAGRMLFVAGQTATDSEGRITSHAFSQQFETALSRVLAVVRAAGGGPEHIARMTVYVTSIQQYRDSRTALRSIWLRTIGAHYPSMTLVQVTALLDDAAVEIDAMAVVP